MFSMRIAVLIEFVEGGDGLVGSLQQLGTECLYACGNHDPSAAVVNAQLVIERARAFLR
jgi:hypothetical protein